MKKYCRNDCHDPLIFPKEITNRPGIEQIKYRIGKYADFREVLFKRLDQETILQGLTHRMADDPAIALLEGAAILGDILTFYQELYANEAYLRTANWRESISDLVKLLGYKLSPGQGGSGTFAFDFRGDKEIDIPRQFPIKVQLKDVKDQINLETKEKITAYPWLSKFRLFRPLSFLPFDAQTQEFFILTPDQFDHPISLKKGDRIFIGDPAPKENPTRIQRGEMVIIDSERTLHGRKIYKIKGRLKRNASALFVVGCKIDKTFNHFGYNAPDQQVVVSTKGFANTLKIQKIRNTHTESKYSYTHPSLDPKTIPLEKTVTDLANGSMVLVESTQHNNKIEDEKTFYHPRFITNSYEGNMKWGPMEAKSTFIELHQSIEENPFTKAQLDRIQIHQVSGPVMILQALPEEKKVPKGDILNFYGTKEALKTLKKRKLAIVNNDAKVTEVNVIKIENTSNKKSNRKLLHRIKLDREINYADFSNYKPITWVYGNLVDATQGKTEKETILGNGDRRQKFQTFKLPKKPLTYFNSGTGNPPEIPELKIYVNDLLWKRVDTFFNYKSTDQIYIVREDEDQNSWIQFGDGKTGSLLPSGIKNIKAVYRTGTGAYGPIKTDTKAQAGGKLENLDKIYLPGFVSGGTEPEDKDNARVAAPGKIQSLNRLVSIKDFESEVLALAGVSKVIAKWDLIDQIPGIMLTVLMKSGREKEMKEIRKIIANYNRCRGPQRFPIIVKQGNIKYVYLDLMGSIYPRFQKAIVKKNIRLALGTIEDASEIENGLPSGLFSVETRTFNQNEYATRIIGILQEIEGVNWVKVSAFGSLGETTEPKNLVLPAEPRPNNPLVSCKENQVLRLLDIHCNINLIVANTKEEC